MRKFPPRRNVRKTFMVVTLASLVICLTIGLTARSLDKSDWKQWTKSDVRSILTKSPWVSDCCRDWNGLPASSDGIGDATPSGGYTASIVSSNLIRHALVRQLQLDSRYHTLDSAHRAEVDQRIAECLSERTNKYIIISFSFNIGPDRKFAVAKANEIHLLLPDGRKIAGESLTDSVAWNCGRLEKETDQYPVVGSFSSFGLYGPKSEVAFPRFLDGNPTVGPNDKKIRVDLDFPAARSWPGHSRPEIDFNVDKLIYQGKPDF